jgi:hypothetical protein
MRRCPHEDQRKHQRRLNRHAARRRDPADHRRKRPGSPANDDVLRRQALQPHRIDDRIEEDRERQQRRRHQVGRQPQHHHADARKPKPQRQRLARLHPARWHRTAGGTRHHRVNVSVPPHVQRARGTGPQRNEQDSGKRLNRVERDRSHQQTHERGEDHKRHHARLQQLHVIAEPCLIRRGCGLICSDIAHPGPAFRRPVFSSLPEAQSGPTETGPALAAPRRRVSRSAPHPPARPPQDATVPHRQPWP